jgi:hypothetical protein
VDLGDSPFPGLVGGSDDFALYDRDEDVFQEIPAQSPTDSTLDRYLTNSALDSGVGGEGDNVGGGDGIGPTSVGHDNSIREHDYHSGFHDDGSGSLGGGSGYYGDPKHGSSTVTFSPQSPEIEVKITPFLTRDRALEATPLLHCLCRDPKWDSSMIQCHGCHGYFHGTCVGISRLKATLLKHFYCPLCIDKNPELVSEFEAEKVEQKQLPVEGPKEVASKKLKSKRHNRR